MVRLTDRPEMTLDVCRGRKTTIQPTQKVAVKDNYPKQNDPLRLVYKVYISK